MPKSLQQIDRDLERFYSPEGHQIKDARFGVLTAARDRRADSQKVVPMRPRARRYATPLEAARVATVTIREGFRQSHFECVIEARQFLVGE